MYQSEIPTGRNLTAPIITSSAPVTDAPVIDIPAVAATLWRRRRLIAATVAGVVAATLVVLLMRVHTYTASTRILIDPRGFQVVEKDLTPNSQSSEGNTAHVENQMRVLTSDKVLGQVVDQQNLATDIEFGAKPPSLLSWPSAMFRAAFGRTPGADQPRAKALRALRHAVVAERPQGSYVIDLFVSTGSPEKSARIANSIASLYLESEKTARNDAAQRISQSLTARADELRERLRTAEQRVESYRQANDILDIGSAGTAGSEIRLLSQEQLSQMNQQVSLAKARTSQAQARVDQIKRLRAEGAGYSAYADAVQSATITQLRTRYSAARELEASLSATLGPQHPRLAAARAQVRDVENGINEELGRIARSARGDLERARNDEADLVARLDTLKRTSVTNNEAQVELRELEREANASRVVYESFLVRAREISEQKGIDTSSERVLSPAVAPVDADGPRSLFILAFAAIFALGLGSALALAREQFDDTIRGPAQLQTLSGLPLLVSIKDLTVPAQSRVVAGAGDHRLFNSGSLPAIVHHRRNSEGAHAFRRLDAMLREIEGPISLRAILVTSAGRDDGKSTVALNMALAAMETGDRVLLVDGDPVGQTLSKAAAVPSATAVGVTYSVVPGTGPGLSLATPGSLGVDSPDISDGRAVRSTVNRLAGEFDTIIIDASTLESSANLTVLADAASDIVVVARAHTTAASTLRSAMQPLEFVWRKVRGTVFLDV